MMKKVWLFLFLLFPSGCEVVSPDNPTQDKTEVPQSANGPRVVLRGTEITFNGQPLKLGDMLENLEKVLGKEHRAVSDLDITRIWDSLGIRAYRRGSDKTRIMTLAIDINRTPPMFPERGYTDTEMPGNGISPVFLFLGSGPPQQANLIG
jgi:hypothetical protein